MTVAYTKESFGSKLFTVTWILDPRVSGGQTGDVFEAVDCERLSIQATSNDTAPSLLHLSNYSPSIGAGLSLSIPNNLFAPHSDLPLLSSLGQARFYWPSVGEFLGANQNLRVSLLFREL